MSFDAEVQERISSAVSAAVVEPAYWGRALQHLRCALGASGAAMFSPTPEGAAGALAATSGCASDCLTEYFRNWLGQGVWLQAAAAMGRFQDAGDVELGHAVLARHALRRTGIYQQFLRRHDIEEIVALKVTDESDIQIPATVLALYRTPSAPDFEEEHCLVLRKLWPCVRRAIHGHYLLQRARVLDGFVESSLDALPDPAWVLRDDMTIEFANHKSDETSSLSAWVQTIHGRLHAVGDLASERLRATVRSRGGTYAVGLASAGRLQRAWLQIVPMKRAVGLTTAWPSAAALVILRLPPATPEHTQWLRHLGLKFRLTEAELRVLARLASGLEPRSIADELHISYATVRTHLRLLYEKTGCRRQAELVLLALGA